MNLQDLVPPLALCKLIPKGEFEDSALLWFSNYHFGGWHIEKRELAVAFTDNGELYPAPTLQEIYDSKEYRYIYEKPMDIEIAMKFWLKLKGIETK